MDVVPWGEYARSVHDFLTGQGKGIPVDFSSRKLVGIGHSMGAVALYVLSPLSTQIPFTHPSSFFPQNPLNNPSPQIGILLSYLGRPHALS